jgi:hypothetical protein
VIRCIFVLFCLLPSHWTCYAVPPNMDEFVHYHALACQWFSGNGENVFREACGGYDLTLLGLRYPGRSYGYIGSSPALLYFPLYLLWPSYIGARLAGGLALIAVYFSLRVLTGRPGFILATVVFWLFPVVFQHIVDTGPISYQFAVAIVVPLALAHATRVWQGGILGAALFVAIWHKMIFVVSGPGMVALYLAVAWRRTGSGSALARDHLRRWRVLAAAAAAVLVPLSGLLASRDQANITYIETTLSLGRSIADGGLEGFYAHFQQIARYLVNLRNFAHRIYGADDSTDPASLLFWIGLAAVFGGALTLANARLLLLAAVAGLFGNFLLLTWIESVSMGHHVILGLPPLVWGLGVALTALAGHWQRVAAAATGVLIALDLYYFGALHWRRPLPENSWDRLSLMAALSSDDFAKTYAYIVVDWGVYYMLALYGNPAQMVLYIEPFGDVERLRATLARTGRKALFVRRRGSSHAAAIDESFPGLRVQQAVVARDDARDWELAYEAGLF